jgi:hypothetical protein
VTQLRAGYTGTAWQVERSDNGLHPEVIAILPTGSSARAFIDSIEGRLSPLRSGPDDLSPASGPVRSDELPGNGPVLPLPAPHSPEAALGRVRAGRSRREVGRAAER